MTKTVDPNCLVATAEAAAALLKKYRTKIADLTAENEVLNTELALKNQLIRELNIKLDLLEGRE